MGIPTHPYTCQILCPHRLFLVSYRSAPGEAAMSQLLNLPVTLQLTQESGCFSSPLPLTHMLTIENVIHTSRLYHHQVSDLQSLISFRDLTQREMYFETLW